MSAPLDPTPQRDVSQLRAELDELDARSLEFLARRRELVREIVSFAKKANDLANIWLGENAVENLAVGIRRISGFGGKGFRMKEIILDLAEVTKAQCPSVEDQLVDFGVVAEPGNLVSWLLRGSGRWSTSPGGGGRPPSLPK